MLDTLTQEFPRHAPRPAAAPHALQGVRVIDFTHFIAGPLATMMLADLGADVIKIEPPGRGDELRHYPPVLAELPGQGGPFVWSNRGKRSVVLDLKNADALRVVRELIAGADVLVENFSTGVMPRFGLDYAACQALNPRLIYCSASAYGREGEFADRLGMDPIMQAESGFVSMNGYADRQGVRASAPVMDIGTAMMVCNAILAALLARTHQGVGQFVEVALYDTAILMTGWAPMQHLFSGREPQRHGNTSPDTCPSGVFQAADQAFYINCGSDKIFQRLAAQVLAARRPRTRRRPGAPGGAHRAPRRAVPRPRRRVRTPALALLARTHARRANPVRPGAQRRRSDPLAGVARASQRELDRTSERRADPQHCFAVALCPNAGRRPGRRAGARAAHARRAAWRARLQRSAHRRARRERRVRRRRENAVP